MSQPTSRFARRLLLASMLLLAVPHAGQALSIDREVTPAYLREHSKELTLKVVKQENGLIAFTVVRTLPKPKYLVARLVVKRNGETVLESSTPAFSRNNSNNFYFAVAPRDLAGSEFELGECHFIGTGDNAVPIPGTINYRFRLSDFVSDELLRPAPTR